jgi:hypothetical protein
LRIESCLLGHVSKLFHIYVAPFLVLILPQV